MEQTEIKYSEEDLLPLSGLQHLLFCERQCALIHIEQAWAENRLTAEGRIMHERVHDADMVSRGDVRIEYAMPLRSLKLGLIAKADVVEFHRKRDDEKTGIETSAAWESMCISPVAPCAGAWIETTHLTLKGNKADHPSGKPQGILAKANKNSGCKITI